VGDRDHIGIRRDVRRSFANRELIALVNTSYARSASNSGRRGGTEGLLIDRRPWWRKWFR